MMLLAPGHGNVSFQQEFHGLPNFPQASGNLSGQLIRITRTNKSTSKHVISLLLGCWPNDDGKIRFWESVWLHDACAILSIDVVDGEQRESARSGLLQDLGHKEYHSFHCDRVWVKDQLTPLWSFSDWPCHSKRVVPIVPHGFLDFLRVFIAQTYRQYHDNRKPVLILGRSLDVSALAAAVLLLLHQACQEARAEVFATVSYLRELCGCNVVSSYPMYEFIYDCLVQVMTSTPTIMTNNPIDFSQIFRHLLSRPRSDLFGPNLNYFDMGYNRFIQPIKLQYETLRKLSAMYHRRLFPAKAVGVTPENTFKPAKRHPFAPKLFRTIWYSTLPSFVHRDHFSAIRGPVEIDTLLELMRAEGSRTLLWISETGNASDILTSCGNTTRSRISLGKKVYHGPFSTFEMSSNMWNVTVFHFAHWPVGSGIRPDVTNSKFLSVVRAVLKYGEEVVSQSPSNEDSHVITTLESESGLATAERKTGCCGNRGRAKYSVRWGGTWRGAMMALVAYVDQRMIAFGEVDIYRTAQLFKMFDPYHIVVSLHQLIWCYKMAWESCRLLNGRTRRPSSDLELESLPTVSARSQSKQKPKSKRRRKFRRGRTNPQSQGNSGRSSH